MTYKQIQQVNAILAEAKKCIAKRINSMGDEADDPQAFLLAISDELTCAGQILRRKVISDIRGEEGQHANYTLN